MSNIENVYPNYENTEEENPIKENYAKCFIFKDSKDCLNEENSSKEKEEKNYPPSKKHKNSTDSYLTEKNLQKFLGEDLIQAIDNDLVEPEDNSVSSESEICNGFITGSSECTSKANSPSLNIRLPKITKDISLELNIPNTSDNLKLDDIKESDIDINDIKEKIKILNDFSSRNK